MSLIINPFAIAPAAVGDPHWANVALLLDSNRDDAATGAVAPVDRSSAARTVTRTAGATLSTAEKKFGAASMAFSGANQQMLSVPDSADWLFGAYTGTPGTGDFTLETWIHIPALGAARYFLSQYNTGSNQRSFAWYYDAASPANLYFSWWPNGSTAGAVHAIGLGAITTGMLNTWVHLAVSRNDGVLRQFVNGAMVSKDTVTSSNFNSTMSLDTGSYNAGAAGGSFNGYLQELRITKGVGRYGSDSSFAVPTAPYPRF